jgi:cephalosporin hydroxylase
MSSFCPHPDVASPGDRMDNFEGRNREMLERMSANEDRRHISREWFRVASRYEYSYHFTWLGRPIIQFPQDILALQEIVWNVKPRVIIETGVARGGSLILHASLLELLGEDGFTVGVDVDIRPHNRSAIEQHSLARRIRLVQGSSVAPGVVTEIRNIVAGRDPVLVILDSNHTHEHVLAELRTYAPLVSKGSYLVVLDTIIEHMPGSFSAGRPWGPGNNPATALRDFLQSTDRFEVDRAIERRLLITVAPGGYLRCVKD